MSDLATTAQDSPELAEVYPRKPFGNVEALIKAADRARIVLEGMCNIRKPGDTIDELEKALSKFPEEMWPRS